VTDKVSDFAGCKVRVGRGAFIGLDIEIQITNFEAMRDVCGSQDKINRLTFLYCDLSRLK